MSGADELSNNVRRLLGLHAMRATRDSRLIDGLSPQALSEIQSGTRRPSLDTLQKLAAFFEIPMDRLMNATFHDLLADEIADPERFASVESKKLKTPP
jgi:transcriptional regulator with XRE-family HTH domain